MHTSFDPWRGGVSVEAIDEIVAEFLVGSHENRDQLDRDLLALEQNPGARELLAGVFRTIHTIKGTSGFLAFHRLEKLTHVGENLLSRLRDGRIGLTDARSTALLKMVDAVRGLLASIEQSGGEGDADHDELIALLSALLEDGPEADAAAAHADEADAVPAPRDEATPAPDAVAPSAGPAAAPAAESAAEPAEAAAEPIETPTATPAADEVPPALIGQVLVQAGDTTPDAVELARIQQRLGDERPLGSILVEHGATTPAAVDGALEAQSAHRSVVDSSVRVDVELLDSLI